MNNYYKSYSELKRLSQLEASGNRLTEEIILPSVISSPYEKKARVLSNGYKYTLDPLNSSDINKLVTRFKNKIREFSRDPEKTTEEKVAELRRIINSPLDSNSPGSTPAGKFYHNALNSFGGYPGGVNSHLFISPGDYPEFDKYFLSLIRDAIKKLENNQINPVTAKFTLTPEEEATSNRLISYFEKNGFTNVLGPIKSKKHPGFYIYTARKDIDKDILDYGKEDYFEIGNNFELISSGDKLDYRSLVYIKEIADILGVKPFAMTDDWQPLISTDADLLDIDTPNRSYFTIRVEAPLTADGVSQITKSLKKNIEDYEEPLGDFKIKKTDYYDYLKYKDNLSKENNGQYISSSDFTPMDYMREKENNK